MGYNKVSRENLSVAIHNIKEKTNEVIEFWKKQCHKEYPVPVLAQCQIILLWNLILR